MRWDNLLCEATAAGNSASGNARRGRKRTFDTPGFAGMTFYEIRAQSIISRVPAASRVPFEWTINPYRGCSHACVYCFARNTHTYLDLDAGHDFDSKVVVKVNARRTAAARAGGTALDRCVTSPWAPMWTVTSGPRAGTGSCAASSRALRDRPTRSPSLPRARLITRDLDLLRQAARRSPGWRQLLGRLRRRGGLAAAEPGTPSPRRRLDAVRQFADAGVRRHRADGADPARAHRHRRVHRGDGRRYRRARVPPVCHRSSLHLRPGAREWYAAWLARHHPELVERYARSTATARTRPRPTRTR